MTRRYLEDFAVGQVFASGRLRVDKKEIIAFAAQFDPQPFHLDEEAARKSVFGGLVASGWHTAALTMRLVVEGEFRPAGGVLGVGFDELNWPHPVRPGDELHTKSEVLEVRPSKSRPDRGLIRVRTTTFNQNSQAVQIYTGNLTVPRRPMAVLRRCAAVLVSREVPRDAEQVLRAGAGLVFSVPVKAHSWSARAKRQPKVTRRTHLFEP